MKAKFIGTDRSMGFRHGRKYFIKLEYDDKKNWIWVREFFGRYCPYASMASLKKNWELPEEKFKPANLYR